MKKKNGLGNYVNAFLFLSVLGNGHLLLHLLTVCEVCTQHHLCQTSLFLTIDVIYYKYLLLFKFIQFLDSLVLE